MKMRIIPKLDIKGENLVKGINLEGLRVLGKPEVFASNYYNNKSVLLVTLEHALIGNFMFSIGLGHYFFQGNIKEAIWFTDFYILKD